MELTGNELEDAKQAALALKDKAGNPTHAHAKRFEGIDTAAGRVVLCNATRQQVRAADMQLDVQAKLGQMNAAREGLFIAMCVVPGPDTLKVWIDDYAELAKDDEVTAAIARLNGARSK